MRQNSVRVQAPGRYLPGRRPIPASGPVVSGLARTAAVMTALAMLAAGCTSEARDSTGVPTAAQTVMAKPAYQSAHWIYQVADLKSGKVLAAKQPGQLVFTASTAKLFTVGTAYDALGPDARLTTPVYATGPIADGVLDGNLALVASGDLAMGGRNAPDDRVDSSFTASSADHVYGDIAPNAVKPPGDPLAGLDSLAKQIAARGITKVTGDVVIDDRLWDVYEGQEGAVPPIYINDNLLDIAVTPAAVGQPATFAATPSTATYQVESSVLTAKGSDASLHVAADPSNPDRILLSGTIGVDAGQRMTVYRIPDAASWARTLFIEALARAGVSVAAAPSAANDPTALPAKGSYLPAQQVASLRSAPISAMGTMILKTSYNTGANDFLCLLAVHNGSTDCLDGLGPIRALVKKAGLAPEDVYLFDGQGADPASTTPAQMVRWLRFTQTQSWGAVFKTGQPVLGESGSLVSEGVHSKAKGKIAAKTGTSAAVEPGTGRALFKVQSLAGFMTTDDGRLLVFDLAMSGGTYPDVFTGLVQAGHDVADVAAALQQQVSQ